MKTIVTKYVGPTNTKGGRIIAKAEGVPSVTIGYHSVEGNENPHAVAAKKLKDKMGWSGKMVGGTLPNGDMAWVFTDDISINPRPSRRGKVKANPKSYHNIEKLPGKREITAKRNPKMKRKASPAQLRARAAFAAMAKARAKKNRTVTKPTRAKKFRKAKRARKPHDFAIYLVTTMKGRKWYYAGNSWNDNRNAPEVRRYYDLAKARHDANKLARLTGRAIVIEK